MTQFAPNEPSASTANHENQSGWRSLFREVINYGGKNLWITFIWVALSALVESFGLILLLPIVEIIILDTPVTGVSRIISTFLSELGASLWWHRMLYLFAAFFAVMIMRAFILKRRDVSIMQLSQGFVDHIRLGLLTNLAYSSWPAIQSLRKAHLLDSLTNNVGRIGTAIRFFTQSIIAGTFALFFIITALIISPAAGSLLLFLTLITAIIAASWLLKSQNLGKKMTAGSQNISKETTRFLDSLKAAKVARAEKIFIEKFAIAVAQTRTVSISFTKQQANMRRGMEFFGAFAAMLLILFGYGYFDLSATELLMVGAILIRLISVLNSALSGLQGVAFALSAFDNAQMLKKRTENDRDVLDDTDDMRRDASLDNINDDANIHLRDIRFGFDRGEKCILSSGDIILPNRGLIIIEGPSGAGKTTLADMLAGLFIPDDGALYYGNLRLSKAAQAHWQKNITYVVQDDFIFDGTVRENILWPNDRVDREHVRKNDAVQEDAQIWQALEDANIADTIRQLPLGLDENLRSGGLRMSGGERQRLGLARAFMLSAPIFIIDEGLSALDHDTAHHIFAALKKRSADHIIILISHNMEHRQYADARIVIENGIIQYISH